MGKSSYTNEDIAKVLTLYMQKGVYTYVARDLGMTPGTVKKIVEENRYKPEFAGIFTDVKNGFSETATRIINKGMDLLEKRIDVALSDTSKLDILLKEVCDDEDMTKKQKSDLIAKIRSMQLQKLGEISTAVGTIYDKRALAENEATDNKNITITLDGELDEWAE